MLSLDDITVTGGPLVPSDPAQVDALESRLWVRFPEGYREYITKLGEGILGGYVRIYPPWRIEKELDEWRRRINSYWFWDKGPELLPKERAGECVLIGDTIDGDELVFHPSRPAFLYVLPRHSETIFLAGNDLVGAVDWFCSSGEVVEPFDERTFEPFDSRNEPAEQRVRRREIADPEGESLDDLLERARQWANRHSALPMAQEALQRHTTKGRSATFVCEAIVLEGEYPYRPGYVAAYRINDSETGQESGFFAWSLHSHGYGGCFSPVDSNIPKLRG